MVLDYTPRVCSFRCAMLGTVVALVGAAAVELVVAVVGAFAAAAAGPAAAAVAAESVPRYFLEGVLVAGAGVFAFLLGCPRFVVGCLES